VASSGHGALAALDVDGVFGPLTSCVLTLHLSTHYATGFGRIEAVGTPTGYDRLEELNRLAFRTNESGYRALNGSSSAASVSIPAALQAALRRSRKYSGGFVVFDER
jgi:hypothetical protein